MESQIFRDISTELDLNGPYLTFSTQPSDQSADTGDSISYTGIATNSYGISGTPENIGTVTYQWYETGVGALSNGGVISGATTNTLTISSVTGGTDDNRTFYLQAEFTPAVVDYESGHAVEDPATSNTVGMTITPDIEIVAQPVSAQAATNIEQTFTVDAKLTNGSRTGLSYQWYVDGVAETNRTKEVTISGSTTSSSPFSYATSSDASYSIPPAATGVKVVVAAGAGGKGGEDAPWQDTGGNGRGGRGGTFILSAPAVQGKTLRYRIGGKGNDGSHGQQASSVGPGGRVSGPTGNSKVWVDFNIRDNAGASNYITIGDHEFDGQSNYTSSKLMESGKSYNVTARSSCGGAWLQVGPPSRINLDDCKPGGDGDYNDQQITVSKGGFSNASGSSATYTIGGVNSGGVGSGSRGGYAGGYGGSGGGGGGGAASMLQFSDGTNIVVAGGGGGGGGGSNEVTSPNATPYGPTHPGVGAFFSGAPIPAVSSGIIAPETDHPSTNDGGGGGGGGGGAPGGSAGIRGNDRQKGGTTGWGGGSHYDDSIASMQNEFENGGNGYGTLSYNTTTTETTTEVRKTVISGVNTPTLTLKSDWNGTQTVKCRVSHGSVTNSPVDSDTVTFAMVPGLGSQNIIVESIDNTSTAQINTIDLSNGDYTIDTSTNWADQAGQSNVVSLYAPNQDLKIQMDLYGGKGRSLNALADPGGEGGYSRIEFTMEQNQEYVIAGLSTYINAPFVYAGANLIAVVGGGGDGGKPGTGGPGGGVNISGEAGFGLEGSQPGGKVVPLGTNGKFGSNFKAPFLYPGDTQAGEDFMVGFTEGGQTILNPKGIYWNQQGKSPSDSLGTTQFRLGNGTIVSNTASITRGYKAGYNIIQTAGKNNASLGGIDSGWGRSGSGATSGPGGTGNNSGGGSAGGGSGYANTDIVTVKDARVGGSTGNAKVIVRVVV